MANHPNRAGKFELTFFGGTKRRYRRWHKTYDLAAAEARRVLRAMDLSGDPADEQKAAHSAIIYGPGCGNSGITIANY